MPADGVARADAAPGDAEIVAIGNELLLGETVDTNSAFVSRRLAALGVRVRRVTVVGDDPAQVMSALSEARARVPWIIAMGGLGPTHDDITRSAVAAAFDRPLELDPAVLAAVEARFRLFGYAAMPESNRCQAEVPAGARVLPNRDGTAPGLVIEEPDVTVFVLPGVPHEMRGLLESGVVPVLAAGVPGPPIRSRVIRTIGVGESVLAQTLGELVETAAPVDVAFLPHLGQVDVRLTARGAAGAGLDALADRIRERAGRWVFGEDGVTLAAAIGAALGARGWTVGVAESCTAGDLAAALTAAPGASGWFEGGVVAYADRLKADLLDVGPAALVHGAVSEATCRALASGARRRLGVDVACATTGIAGPGGGTAEKPVGLVWFGVETPEGAIMRHTVFPGDRDEVRRRATIATLGLLIRAVRDGIAMEAA
ncbi:MAG: competence/damage-inducible protein A [Gemmatimonadota bacterium]